MQKVRIDLNSFPTADRSSVKICLTDPYCFPRNDDASLVRLFQGVIGHPHFNYHIIRGHWNPRTFLGQHVQCRMAYACPFFTSSNN